jgi:hypothetical protein
MSSLTQSSDLVQTNSSTNVSASTDTAINRLSQIDTTTTLDINQEPVVGNVVISDATLATKIMTPSTSTAPTNQVGITQPIGYKFNLPPHDWSLPLRPTVVDPYVVGTTQDSSFHGLRRGRIWYWAGANNFTSNTSTSTTTTAGASTTGSSSAPLNLIDTSWGFQFLWNPTSISTNVSRNMDITPSSADTLRVVAGVFPGQETVSLDIVLDRTNDFACIRAAADGDFFAYTKYYSTLYPGANTSQDMTQQITALMGQGTMADLEYLFKAVNGSGNGSLQWTNLLGKQTANIGYLAPTLLGIQLGPTLNNLSYVGWISNLSINHTAFTENMIPIRTEVGISIQCFAGSGLTSGA